MTICTHLYVRIHNGCDSRRRLRERRVIKRQKFGTQQSLVLLSQVSTAREGEIMQCLQAPPLCDLSVLERQRARLNWQQQQQGQEQYLSAYNLFEGDYSCMQSLLPMQASFHSLQSGGENNESHGHVDGPLDCMSNGWPYLASTAGATTHCPVPGAAIVEEASTVAVSNGSSRKRKPENSPKSKQLQETGRDDSKSKRVKEETGGSTSESKQSNMNKEAASADTSKEKGKSDKADFIHVRARRGQATDSHSLAERVRRERISQRMKYLQDLVPGCSKITGKAGMLDEIINYVQSLQRQVEFLSMKLAAVNPMMDISIDSFFGREINPAYKSGSSPAIGMLSELPEQPYLQFSSLQSHPCPGLDMFMDSHCSDMQANSAAVAVPLPDASFGSCINVNGPTVWNTNLQNLHGVEFQLGRGPAFPIQSLQGSLLPNSLKMEM